LSDLLDFVDQVGKFEREDGLNAVGEGGFGIVVNFDEETVGAHGYGGAGEGKNFVAFAGAMAGVDEDG